MRRLFPFLKWFWPSVAFLIPSSFGISYLQEGTLKLADDIKQWLASPLHFGIVVGSTVVLLLLTWWAWYDHRRAGWKQAFKFIKPVKRVKPHDLNSEFKVCQPGETAPTDKRPFYEGYVPRHFRPYHPQDATRGNCPQNDAQLLEAVRQQQHVLLVGAPTEGKTRTAYELIKHLKGYTVVIPHSERPTPTEAIRLLKDRRVVLFLDDLNYIKNTTALDIVYFVDEVIQNARLLTMVATCRNGSELLAVTELTSHRAKQLYERFWWVLTLDDSTADEKKRVAQQSGLNLTTAEVEASPTVGWVVMEEAYKKMYDRFQRLSISEKETLWTLQLLSAAGVFPLTQTRVQQVRTHVFKTDATPRLVDVLRTLASEDFIQKTATPDPIQVRDAYLSLDTEKVVVPYAEGKNPKDDFEKLGEAFIQSKDDEGLEHLGIRLLEQYDDGISALKYLELARKLDPSNERFLYNEGGALSRLKRYPEAIERYQQAVKLKPDKNEAWNNMGSAYQETGQYQKAIECYRKAINYRSDDYQSHNNMGVAFAALGNFGKAINCYERALKYKVGYYQALRNMGNAFYKLGQYEDAVVRFQEATDYKSDYHEAWHGMGVAFSALRQYRDAIDSYQQAVHFAPNHHNAWYNMGVAFFSLKKVPQAIKAVRHSIETAPNIPERWSLLGILLARVDDNEAVTWLCKAWQARSSLTESQVGRLAGTLKELGVDPTACTSDK